MNNFDGASHSQIAFFKSPSFWFFFVILFTNTAKKISQNIFHHKNILRNEKRFWITLTIWTMTTKKSCSRWSYWWTVKKKHLLPFLCLSDDWIWGVINSERRLNWKWVSGNHCSHETVFHRHKTCWVSETFVVL